MIDLHCHVLPGLDDGPETVEGSLALARAALAAGTTTLLATPHINRRYEIGPTHVRAELDAFRQRLVRERIELDVRMGGEISCGRLASLPPEQLEMLRLGDGPYVLLEAPLSSGLETLPSAVERLQRDGYGVLLAHPERSPGFQRDPAKLRELVDRGALCSITATSLSGRFGRVPCRFAFTLLRMGLVHDIASDAHDAYRRPPDLREGLAAAGAQMRDFDEHATWLTQTVPAAILAGSPLPPRPALPRGRWWQRPSRAS